MDLVDRVALITGGKRIGAVVAVALARAGADVALVYKRSRAEADQTASEVRGLGRRAVTIQADVTDPAACAALVEQTVRDLGRLDVLVNMASIYRSIPLAELTAAAWDAQLDVDLRAAFLCAHAAIPAMRKNGGGRIINFSDWIAASGRPRYPGYVPYFVAKRGIIALTEALALGAQDALPQGEDERLVLVANRELANLEQRRARRAAEVSLREAEKRCQLLLDSSVDAIANVHDGMHIYANRA